ncbi:hypothetical protein pb186bvf_020852 [Paramecium bursaria]
MQHRKTTLKIINIKKDINNLSFQIIKDSLKCIIISTVQPFLSRSKSTNTDNQRNLYRDKNQIKRSGCLILEHLQYSCSKLNHRDESILSQLSYQIQRQIIKHLLNKSTIPKPLICLICLQVAHKPLACADCSKVFCKRCYQIYKCCMIPHCNSQKIRLINIAHKIYLREIQIFCIICQIYVVGLNYTNHIKLCLKREQTKVYENNKQIILVGQQNDLVLQQIKDMLRQNDLMEQRINGNEDTIQQIRILELKCNLCSISFTYFQIDQHIQNCQEIQIKCDNKQCNWVDRRRNFNIHHPPCTQQLLSQLLKVELMEQNINNLQLQLMKQSYRDEGLLHQRKLLFKFWEICYDDFQTIYKM